MEHSPLLIFVKGCEDMEGKHHSRPLLSIFIMLGLIIAAAGGYLFLQSRIPDSMTMARGEETGFEIAEAGSLVRSNIPEGQVKIDRPDNYTVQYSLLGIIPLKEMQVNVVDRKVVSPSGMPIGIYMETSGVLVVGTGKVNGLDGLDYEPSENILKSGDYIMAVNGTSITGKQELVELVNKSQGKEMTLDVLREGEKTTLAVSPVMTGPTEYKLGLWVRDNTQGIGTLTYVDGNGDYGALGHGISDVDAGTLLSLSSGKLYHTDILSVVKGEKGSPGELSGVIHYQDDQILGTITKNTDMGIFGHLTCSAGQCTTQKPLEVAYKQEIETGPATVLTTVDGHTREYGIEITKINLGSQDVNKSMVIRVTDPELLEKTGGIVQGMSGSPILQNGRIIGAVTHVFIQDSTCGYGIFIENMISVD